MTQYIPKDAVVAEIENIEADTICHKSRYAEGSLDVIHRIKHLLNTLEVKDVDLDRDIRTYLTNHFNIYEDGVLQSKKSGLPLSTYDIIKVAEHFFELGLKIQKGEEV